MSSIDSCLFGPAPRDDPHSGTKSNSLDGEKDCKAHQARLIDLGAAKLLGSHAAPPALSTA